MTLHPWWESFGRDVSDPGELMPGLASELAFLVAENRVAGVTLTGLRWSTEGNLAGVSMDVEVERPQDLEHPIRGVEPIAVVFPSDGGQPSALCLREDFPETPHQNWVPSGMPCSLCIDDRPWNEARLSATGFDILRRIQVWLSKTARGELHDVAQPPEPLFFRSPLKLILPSSVLVGAEEPIELVGFIRDDNDALILTRETQESDVAPALLVLGFHARPQGITRLRHAPRTLEALAAELKSCGIELYEELKHRLKTWAGLDESDVRRLTTRLAIVVTFPVEGARQRKANEIRAFISSETTGDIGVALGVLHANESEVGDHRAYMVAIPAGPRADKDLLVEPTEVHFQLSRELAALVSGTAGPDLRRATLVGAGSLGSQFSLNLAREGAFVWTVVDCDELLPHNLVRHALFAEDVGARKASALAFRLGSLVSEPVVAIECDVLRPTGDACTKLDAAFRDSRIIFDASASVAVSRHLCDLNGTDARRVCVFFTPSGNSVVLLVEDVERSITLRDLEAQYFRLVLSEPHLAGHLEIEEGGVRISGSCRALTNRISASNSALLSALAARGAVHDLGLDSAAISIWTLNGEGEVQRVRRDGCPVSRVATGGWSIVYDEGLVQEVSELRARRLPRETGGVLLGIADMAARSVHMVHALSEPEDSQGSETEFERGIVDLSGEVSRAGSATMYQVRYIGEWHSHPEGASSMPSPTDVNQVKWLGQELKEEGLPGLIAISGGNDSFSVRLSV